jgi:hypothetical protein
MFPSWRSPEQTVNLLNEICERRGFTTFRMLIPPSYTSVSGSAFFQSVLLNVSLGSEF